MGFWSYQTLGGITPDPAHPGFERVIIIIIRPQIARDLTWVKAEHDSIRSTIASRWTLDNDHLTLRVTIPPNTTALVYVAAIARPRVKDPAGPLVKFQRMQGACALFEVALGRHDFESDLPKLARQRP